MNKNNKFPVSDAVDSNKAPSLEADSARAKFLWKEPAQKVNPSYFIKLVTCQKLWMMNVSQV